MAFSDGTPGPSSSIISPLEQTYGYGQTSDVPLSDFLKRPVQIYSGEWTTGSILNFVIQPWKLFLDTPAIRNRVEGYRFVRGHLNIRIVVTGNPFLFGRVLVGYEPWATRSVWYLSGMGTPAQRVYKCVVSQMPHIEMDFSTSQGGEMVLPFFSPYNWLDVTAENMTRDMGSLHFTNLTTLQHANAESGTGNFVVFAWMSDAELCVPTISDYNEENYQGEGDEFSSNGLISKPASAVARAAGALAKIPVFRPYALPTEMAASAIAGAAAVFGFSRPQVVDNLCQVREKTGGELATTNTHEVIGRLALDAKSQLTVDPRTVGLDGTDEMSFRYITSREALVSSFFWNEADTPGERIWANAVTPMYHCLDNSVTPARSGIPPCTAVGALFRNWRGTMVYRFSIVASAMHRGKLRISYEPNANVVAGPTHSVYSRIIDLAETRDFEIPIHWHQPTPWQKVVASTVGSIDERHYNDSTPSLPTYASQSFNGYLSVTVLTPLTSPDPSLGNSIAILWYPRGGDDLEFANPTSTPVPWSYRSSDDQELPQGEVDDIANGVPEKPIDTAHDTLDPIGTMAGTLTDPLTHVFFGESVVSLRAFAKRYRAPRSSHPNIADIVRPNHIEAGVRADVATNFMPFLEYVMPWYVGWRGSMRFRQFGVTHGNFVVAERGYQAESYLNNGYAGSYANTSVAEVEIPFYSYKRFELTRNGPTWSLNPDSDSVAPNQACARFQQYVTTTATGIVPLFQAAGDDFSLFFFLGIPPVFVN